MMGSRPAPDCLTHKRRDRFTIAFASKLISNGFYYDSEARYIYHVALPHEDNCRFAYELHSRENGRNVALRTMDSLMDDMAQDMRKKAYLVESYAPGIQYLVPDDAIPDPTVNLDFDGSVQVTKIKDKRFEGTAWWRLAIDGQDMNMPKEKTVLSEDVYLIPAEKDTTIDVLKTDIGLRYIVHRPSGRELIECSQGFVNYKVDAKTAMTAKQLLEEAESEETSIYPFYSEEDKIGYEIDLVPRETEEDMTGWNIKIGESIIDHSMLIPLDAKVHVMKKEGSDHLIFLCTFNDKVIVCEVDPKKAKIVNACDITSAQIDQSVVALVPMKEAKGAALILGAQADAKPIGEIKVDTPTVTALAKALCEYGQGKDSLKSRVRAVQFASLLESRGFYQYPGADHPFNVRNHNVYGAGFSYQLWDIDEDGKSRLRTIDELNREIDDDFDKASQNKKGYFRGGLAPDPTCPELSISQEDNVGAKIEVKQLKDLNTGHHCWVFLMDGEEIKDKGKPLAFAAQEGASLHVSKAGSDVRPLLRFTLQGPEKGSEKARQVQILDLTERREPFRLSQKTVEAAKRLFDVKVPSSSPPSLSAEEKTIRQEKDARELTVHFIDLIGNFKDGEQKAKEYAAALAENEFYFDAHEKAVKNRKCTKSFEIKLPGNGELISAKQLCDAMLARLSIVMMDSGLSGYSEGEKKIDPHFTAEPGLKRAINIIHVNKNDEPFWMIDVDGCRLHEQSHWLGDVPTVVGANNQKKLSFIEQEDGHLIFLLKKNEEKVYVQEIDPHAALIVHEFTLYADEVDEYYDALHPKKT